MSCKTWGAAALATVSLTALASCTVARPISRATDAGPNYEAPGDNDPGDTVPGPTVDRPAPFDLPPAGVPWDYQIGKANTPLDPVRVISRDRLMAPVPSTPDKPMYNICYVNGFQAQPDDSDRVGPPPEGTGAWWEANHLDLVRRQDDGTVIKDTGWDEDILDITTPEKRVKVAEVVGAWIDGCAQAGFQGVEIDNLDSYERTGGSEEEQAAEKPYAVAYMRMLADRAHSRGLAIGQKNASDLVPQRTQMGADFAVVEECYEHNECDRYSGTAGYGNLVYIVEYQPAAFARGCASSSTLSLVLRDKKVRTTTKPGDLCVHAGHYN